MNKFFKFFVVLIIFACGVMINVENSDAKLPGDQLDGGQSHTCYTLAPYNGNEWHLFDCKDCVQKKATVSEGTPKGTCTK